MHDSEQVEEFMGELYDKFYPQVMEGLELMQADNLQDGIEMLARPLHTIKGVTGFMSGFEEASHFTHAVESYLKKIQSGDIALDDAVSSAAIESVNMIFQVIEQIKESGSGPADEMERVTGMLDELAAPKGAGAAKQAGGIEMRLEETTIVATVTMQRIHTPEECAQLVALAEQQNDDVPLLLDVSGVRSISSALLERLAPHAFRFPLHILGANAEIRGLIHIWGCNELVHLHVNFAAYETAGSPAPPPLPEPPADSAASVIPAPPGEGT